MVRLEGAAGIGDVELAEGHAAAEFFVGLAEAERLAEGGEAGLEVGDRLRSEVVVEIRREERAVDVALLKAAVDFEGLLLGSAARVAGDERRGEPSNSGSGANGVLVGKYGHGGTVIDEDFIVRGEAGDLARVLDGAMALAIADFDAEAVFSALSVFQLDLGKHLLVALGGENRLSNKALVPEGEVVGGHGELAGGEHPACAFFWRGTQRPESVAIVGGGVGRHELVRVGVPDGGHAQGAEDMLGEKLKERLAGDDLNDAAGDDVVGVRVLPLCAGIEVERLLGPGVEDLLRGGGLEHGGHDVVLGPVVLIAGGVRENLADCDFVAAGEAGDVLADRVVEGEFFLLLEHEDCGGRELLGDGADGIAHGGRGGDGGSGVRCEAREAVGVGVNELAVLDDGDGGGRDAGGFEDLRGDAIDTRAEVG